jgi:hypothetical protein
MSTTTYIGRPTDYTEEITYELCGLLAEGLSLNSICKRKDMPSRATVYNWLSTHPSFLDNYMRAKDDGADALADDIQDIAEDVRGGKLDPNAGRVAGDLKKWVASKLKPKKYGERIQHANDEDNPMPAPIFGGVSAPDKP